MDEVKQQELAMTKSRNATIQADIDEVIIINTYLF